MASTARVNGWLLADLFRPVKRRCGHGTLIPAPYGSGADQSNQGPLSTSGGCPNPLRHLQEFPSLYVARLTPKLFFTIGCAAVLTFRRTLCNKHGRFRMRLAQ